MQQGASQRGSGSASVMLHSLNSFFFSCQWCVVSVNTECICHLSSCGFISVSIVLKQVVSFRSASQNALHRNDSINIHGEGWVRWDFWSQYIYLWKIFNNILVSFLFFYTTPHIQIFWAIKSSSVCVHLQVLKTFCNQYLSVKLVTATKLFPTVLLLSKCNVTMPPAGQ